MKKEILDNIYNSKRNVIIDGDMSTGKTSNVGFSLVKKIIDNDESMLILDSKEEYLNKYYNDLKNKDYNIVIINMKDYTKSEGWNILEYPYNLYKNGYIDSSIKYLDKITNELFITGPELDPFWSNSAGNFFKGIALSLFEDAKEEEINLSSISTIINDTNENEKINYVAEYFRTKEKTDPAYICASGTVFMPKETMGGIIATAKQFLNPIVNKKDLNILLSKTTFDLETLLNRKNAIFLINSEDETDISSLISIFINQLYLFLKDNKNNNNFNFVLDNFDSINDISNLKNILSSCISHNIKFYITTRDKEELEKKYSNYINKLSNSISLDDDQVSIRINNQIMNFNNEIIEEQQSIPVIDYPSVVHNEINIFNLKKYVLENIKVDK